MRSDYSGPVNIGNPNEFTMLELATKVLAMTGSPSEIEFLPLPVDDPNRRRPVYRDWDCRAHRSRYDNRMTREVLGWAPAGTREAIVRDGLVAAVRHYMR